MKEQISITAEEITRPLRKGLHLITTTYHVTHDTFDPADRPGSYADRVTIDTCTNLGSARVIADRYAAARDLPVIESGDFVE